MRERCTFPSVTNLRFHRIQTVDSWIRDYGPNFLINGHGDAAFNDWIFNAWGNKYETLKQDDRIPRVLEPGLQLRRFEPGIVMEGGAIDVNGAGCVLTTEQCLLNPNRNPHLSREGDRGLPEELSRRQQGPVARRRNRRRRYGRAHRRHRAVCSAEHDRLRCRRRPGRCELRIATGQSHAAQVDDRRRADVPLKSLRYRCRVSSAGPAPTRAISIGFRRVMPISTSPTTSCSLPCLGTRMMRAREKHFSACFPIDAWSRSTANHSFGAWARSTASPSNNLNPDRPAFVLRESHPRESARGRPTASRKLPA